MQIPDNFCRILEPDNPDFNERFACSDCGENFITLCDAARLKQTIAELRAEVERLSWKLITPESLPNRGDEALRLPSETHGPIVIPAGFDARPEDPQECDRYVGAGFTHYRPINPPASNKGEDTKA